MSVPLTSLCLLVKDSDEPVCRSSVRPEPGSVVGDSLCVFLGWTHTHTHTLVVMHVYVCVVGCQLHYLDVVAADVRWP